MQDYNKLAIVGNGFDLAHGLKTNYSDFVKDRKLVCPSLAEFEKEVEETLKFQGYEEIYATYKARSDIYWYDFEKVIGDVTHIAFQEFMRNYGRGPKSDNELEVEYSQRITKINQLFEFVRFEFYDYLNKEFSNFNKQKINNITKELDENTFVINFNFTPTVEVYTQNIDYIHGLLNSGDPLVFGFPLMDRADFSDPQSEVHNKAYQRDLLHFSRFIRDLGISSSSDKYSVFIKEMKDIHIPSLHSGRGGYREITVPEIQKYADLNEHYVSQRKYAFEPLEIEEVVIMGHSIFADKEVLSNLFKNMDNLKRIKLYSYQGESNQSLVNKVKGIERILSKQVRIHIEPYTENNTN